MDFRMLSEENKHNYSREMFSMLTYSDREFVPPLSARSSTTQKDLSGGVSSEEGIRSYFEEMRRQQILGAFEGDVLLGFVSFRENYISDVISKEQLPNIYLSTLVGSQGEGDDGADV